ncbi:unnamed protein product [Vicia faba]|uniref:histone acetyltransferase n=1 Tax=Vicia faba TaxID=3906 RepID=A0AAV0ZLL9_VICFA|nr:unnamed protein product [Vicia faba]
MSEMQNQFQQNSSEDCSRSAQYLSFPSGQHDLSSSAPQNLQQMWHPHQLVAEYQNKFSCLTVGAQSNSKPVVLNQWPDSQDGNHMSNNISHDQHLHVDFHQRISGKDEAHYNNLSSYVSMSQVVAPRGAADPPDSGSDLKNAHKNEQRWLLFLLHARRCSAPEGRCQERCCSSAQNLCKHIDGCTLGRHYPYPHCHHNRVLLRHFMHCKDPCCPVCVFVKNYRCTFQLKAQIQPESQSSFQSVVNGSCKSYNITAMSSRLISNPTLVVETSEGLHPSLKRIKKTELHTNTNASNQHKTKLGGKVETSKRKFI